MNEINFAEITTQAYLELISARFVKFPVSPLGLKTGGLVFCSYQQYCAKSGISFSYLAGGLEDGYCVQNLRPGLCLILYDSSVYTPRKLHTLWHEVGHIRRKHKRHGNKEEVEAHFFASQINMPNVIIKEIRKRGYEISTVALMKYFGVSSEAADKKMQYIKYYPELHNNPYDDAVLFLFNDWLNNNYPSKISRFNYDSEYEMEGKRERWVYGKKLY